LLDADGSVEEARQSISMLSGGGWAIVAVAQSRRKSAVFLVFRNSVLRMRRVRRLRKF
jgi:hypothetical protein